jgi:hypothetical protein
MLRLLVLLLLLVNAAYFAWSQELLASWGFAPAQQSEPQRLQQQIRPEAVRVLSSGDARRVETSQSNPVECLQAGVFTAAQTDALKQALQAWPDGSWSLEPGVEPARWIVYMGKYQGEDHVNKKKAELRWRGVSFEPLGNAALEPGLSLGGFPTEAAATLQLEALAAKGVRTARVVQERPEAKGVSLKLAAVNDTLRPRLANIKTALAGKAFHACR